MQRLIDQTLKALQTRLAENKNMIQVQVEGGDVFNATCTFHPPATENEILDFERQTGYRLPADYKNFLKISNGCRLFDHVTYGGEIQLYSLQELIDYNQVYDAFEGCFTIASVYQDHIVINSKHVLQNKQYYLYWKGSIESFEDARPLSINFETWLDRIIVCQGTKFWLW
ncbi:MAG: SMI1/KNR4 family protein [Solibacillus sp.]|uniref:SMI1/KNR4 family protein n=1 Tax=unclassified Solibacillus TaxID=2637870 RepID=UPI0030FB6934